MEITKAEEIKIDELDHEDAHLVTLGYKPTLHRGLAPLMNFAFGFTEVACLASISVTLGYGLNTGGPATLLWTFVVNFIITIFIGYSMAELCGAYPSAGSVYHWSAQVGPREWGPLFAYITGWSNFAGNAAGDASFATGCASFLSASIKASGGKLLDNGPQVGVSIAILVVASILNFFRVDQIGWMNNLFAIAHGAAIIIIIVALLSLTPELSTAKWVFTEYYSSTGFEDHSYVGAVGITSALFAFVGYEASAHMAEETKNAKNAASKGIISTILATGFGGVALILAFLFSSKSLFDVMLADDDSSGSPGTGNAVVNLFILVGGEKWGCALAWLVTINLFFALISSVAVTGRITYALARDGAFPYSSVFAEINPYFKSPVNSILMVMVFDGFLQLLPLDTEGGSVAFTSIIGLCVIGFQVSYGLPILIKLVFDPKDFPKTEMDLGVWSKPFGVISCLWLFGTSCLLFFPIENPTTSDNMNWLIVVVGGVFIIGSINWIFNSRFNFKGPTRHEDILALSEKNIKLFKFDDKGRTIVTLESDIDKETANDTAIQTTA